MSAISKFEQAICRDFGVVPSSVDPDPPSDYRHCRTGIYDLDGQGLVYRCQFFPFIPGVTCLQLGFLKMPRACAECGKQPIVSAVRIREWVEHFAFRHILHRVGAYAGLCAEHSRCRPRFRFCISAHDKMRYSHCTAYCRQRDFLQQLLDLNTRGEMYPPWLVFPERDPHLGWNQGTADHWRMFGWDPFWGALPADERESYLHRWDAPEDWAEFLRGFQTAFYQ